MGRGWKGLIAAAGALILLAAARPAAAQSAGGSLTPLDARHVALLRGDRIVIYEVDPARNHALRVVNTILLDAEGQILGQFTPEKPAVAPSAAPRPGATPAPRVKPVPAFPSPATAPQSVRLAPGTRPARKLRQDRVARR